MDSRIESAAIQQRAIGQLHLQWMLDRWKLDMGMLDILPKDSADDSMTLVRELRRRRATKTEIHYRFLPTFDGYGLLVRDKDI